MSGGGGLGTPTPVAGNKEQARSRLPADFWAKWLPAIVSLVGAAGIWAGALWEQDDKLLQAHLEAFDARLESLDRNIDTKLQVVDTKLQVVDTKLESLDDKLSQVQGSLERRLTYLERRVMGSAGDDC
ncbi:MAG: hypothetical protein OXK76_02450 [Gammaproteobacteria bacterium]|nr:hypothetical protein [Gammaproteobacteria bacterium]